MMDFMKRVLQKMLVMFAWIGGVALMFGPLALLFYLGAKTESIFYFIGSIVYVMFIVSVILTWEVG